MAHENAHALDLDGSFLHALYNGLIEGVFVTRLKTRHIVYWNKGAEALFGYSSHEMLGWTPALLFPISVLYDHFYETAEQLLQNRDSWKTELEYQHRGAEALPVEVTLTVLDQAGGDQFLVHVVRDMRDRKQAKSIIRSKVRQLALIAELGHLALGERSLSVLFTEAITRVTHTLGADYGGVWQYLPKENLLRLQAGCGWPDTDIGTACIALQKTDEERHPLLSEKFRFFDNCQSDPSLSKASIFRTSNIQQSLSVPILGPAHPFGMLGVYTVAGTALSQEDAPFLQDIANILAELIERHRVEKDLRHREAMLHDLIQVTQEAVISIDQHGCIVLFNPAAENMFGYRLSEVQGKKVNILMPEPYASEHDGYIERYANTHEPRAIGRIRCVAAKRSNGDIFPIELSISEIGLGEQVQYTAFIRDLSGKVAVLGDREQDEARL